MELNNSLNLLELDNHEQKILIDYIPNLINENQVDKIKSQLVRLKRYVLNDLSKNKKLWVDFLKLQNRENEIAIPKKENDNLEVFFQIIPSPSTISSNYLTIDEYNKIEGHNEFPFDLNYEKENFLQYLIDSGVIKDDKTEALEGLWEKYKVDYAEKQESYCLIDKNYIEKHLYECCIDEENKFNKMLFDDIVKNGIEHTICKFIPKLSTEYLIEDNKNYDIKKLDDAFFDVCNKVLNNDKGLRFDEKGKLITCDYKRYPYLDRFNLKELKEFENFVIKDGKNYENLHKNYFEKINFLNSMLNSVENITTLTQEDYSKFVQYGIDDKEKISKNFSIEP